MGGNIKMKRCVKIQCLGCFQDFESKSPQAIVAGVDICPACKVALIEGQLVMAQRARVEMKPKTGPMRFEKGG